MKIITRFFFTILLGLLFLVSCGKSPFEGDRYENLAPETFLSSGPPEGTSNTSYMVHFFWNGYDSDGAVSHFEYLITDDFLTGPLVIDENIGAVLDTLGGGIYEWYSTELHDSIFIVEASHIPDGENPDDDEYFYGDGHFLFKGQHTFFIRAVDEFGKPDPIPAYRSFTATTIAPIVDINHPLDLGQPGGWETLPEDIFMSWTGKDSVGNGTVVIDPDSTRVSWFAMGEYGIEDNVSTGDLLALPEEAWLPWKGWDEEEDSVTQLSGKGALVSGLTPFGPGESGEYIFLVQAKDEAGAVTSHFEDGTNMKKIKASSVLSPTLYVSEPTLGFKMSEEWSVYDFTIAEDQPLNFQWYASAESYGSKITGYRYGWDIIDTDNDDEWTNWSLPDDPAASNSFSSSTHWLYIQCKDYSGNISTILLRFLVIPFTMEKELLFIDDYDNTFLSVGFDPNEYEPGEYYPPTWASNFVKTDAGMKSFWEDMLSDYADWNPYSDFFRVDVLTTRPPFELIANYKHIVWESASSQTASGLYWITRFVDPRTASDVPFDYVSAFMKRGGQVMICGTLPIYATIPKSGDVDDSLNPNRNWTPLSYMRNFFFQTGSVEESVKRYLPYQQFGIDVLIKTIEPLPRPPLNVAVKPYKTVPTYWGMVAAEPTRLEEESFSLNYPLPDSLLMSEDVQLWFDYAAGVFDHDGYFGLSDVEAYNWDWYAQYVEPPIFYRESRYIRFLNYVPADSTTRYGRAPVAVHPHEEENQSETVNMDELAYSVPHVTDEGDTLYGSAAGPEHGLAIGLIGLDNPDAPNVILGFHPLYLDRDHAKQLIDHILVDIFDIEK